MPKEDWLQNPLHKIFGDAGLWPMSLNNEINTVLDVACGLSLKSQYIKPTPRCILGIDIYEPYLRKIDYEGSYATMLGDVRRLDKFFMEDSFDLVIALDVIEHLKPREGAGLIQMCKFIARKAVVIETPKGVIPQNIDILHMDGDRYQTHRSGWQPEQFEAEGFKCVVRPYKMNDVPRHTTKKVDPNIEMIDAIYVKGAA